jgi:hypothetical protein
MLFNLETTKTESKDIPGKDWRENCMRSGEPKRKIQECFTEGCQTEKRQQRTKKLDALSEGLTGDTQHYLANVTTS